MTDSELRRVIESRPLVFEGAFDPNLPYFREFPGDWEPYALTRPELVRKTHEDFLAAGCDVLQTFTWGLHSGLEAESNRDGIVAEAARRAAEIAVEAVRGAADRDGRRRWVAGVVNPGPTTVFHPEVSLEELGDAASLIASSLVAGGVDLLIIALAQSIADARAMLEGAAKAVSNQPILLAYELGPTGLLSGENIETALAAAADAGAFSAGIYLTTDLTHTPEGPLLAASRRAPIYVLADAGSVGPTDYGRAVAAQARRLGLKFVGGGWAIAPAHIRALRAEVDWLWSFN